MGQIPTLKKQICSIMIVVKMNIRWRQWGTMAKRYIERYQSFCFYLESLKIVKERCISRRGSKSKGRKWKIWDTFIGIT